ncbi:MAG: dihydrodipicolinate synthase family protein [Candidatus Tumulicola sp.]
MAERGLHGIWAAVVTPIDATLRPDAAKAIEYYGQLLQRGCDGINLFGTTGEAMSFGTRRRLELMQAVAGSGLPMKRFMAGTGAASLDEAARLTQAAINLKFTAALLMPPFFYRDAGDDGVLRFFDKLFGSVSMPRGAAILYNFPLMSGITFHPDLVDRLVAAFPETIGGLKDSSNDRALQAEVLRRHPGLALFPGSEHYLHDAIAAGAAGCISGSAALWPELTQAVYRDGAAADARQLADCRMTLTGFPFVAAVRHRIAVERRDDSWRLPMPPLVPLAPEERVELDRRFRAAATRPMEAPS